MFAVAKLACKYSSNLVYGDDQSRYNALEHLIKNGAQEPEIMNHMFSLAERLIQIDHTGTATTTNPKVMEQFATLISNHPELFSKTPQTTCDDSYEELSLGDLLYHTGMISAAHHHHEIALKIYEHTLTLQHTKTCGHIDRIYDAKAISLIAAGRYQEAAKCNARSLNKLYANNPMSLSTLLQHYEHVGLYKEAITILQKLQSANSGNIFIKNLLIKKLAIYITCNPSDPFFTVTLAENLHGQKEGVLQELERQLVVENQFAAVYHIKNGSPKANALSTPITENKPFFFSRLYQSNSSPKIHLPPSPALSYAYKAYKANHSEQAYHLFQKVLEEDVSTKNIEHIYTYLRELSLSAIACKKLGDYPVIITPLLKHPQCDIEQVLRTFLDPSTVSDDFTPCLKLLLPQINERLQKESELLLLYEHLLSKKEGPLSTEDITHWFTPLIKLYNKDPLKATTLLFAEMNYFNDRDPRKASLQMLLKAINVSFFEAIESFRRVSITGHILSEANTFLLNFNTAHKNAPLSIKELYAFILNVATNAHLDALKSSESRMPVNTENPEITKAIVHIQNYLQLIPTPTDQLGLSGLDDRSIQSLPMTEEPLSLPNNTHPTTSIFIDLIPASPDSTDDFQSVQSFTSTHSTLSINGIDDDATEIQMDPMDPTAFMTEEEFITYMRTQQAVVEKSAFFLDVPTRSTSLESEIEEEDLFMSVPTTPTSLEPVDHESTQFKSEDEYQDWILKHTTNQKTRAHVQGYGGNPLNS